MNENFENNVNEYTSDVVSGVEQAPKKKGAKIAAIAAGAVVAVGGGGAVAYNCSDYVKNQVKLATLEPAEYYAWVAEENSKEFSNGLAESYDKYLDALNEGQSASVSFKYETTDAVKELFLDGVLGEAASQGIDEESEGTQLYVDMINSINSIEIGSDAQTKKNASSGSAYVSVNDEKLASAEFTMDTSAMEYFFRIPEINDKWLGYSDDTTEEEMGEYYATSADLMNTFLENPEEIITAAEIDEIVTRYTSVWSKSIEDVELEKKEEVDICDISVEYTVLTSKIDEKAAKKIAENFINEAAEDELLKEIITERLEICTADEYDTALEEALAEVEESTDSGSDDTVTLITYVDATGTVRGMALEMPEEEELKYVMGLDGDDVRGEFIFNADDTSMKAELIAAKDGKKYDGDISFEVTSPSYDYETGEETSETTKFSVEFTDFEIVDEEKGYMNGVITLVIPEIDPISLTLESDGKSQDISFNLNIDGTDYGTFTLGMSEGKYDEDKVPAAEDALMITDDFDIESYVTEDDMSAFITSILTKLGLSEENAALLGDEAAASMFAEDIVSDEEIIWDDEDYEWDDEEIIWDDEDYEWDDEEIDWEDYEAELTVESEEAFLCIADNSFMAYSYGDVYDTLVIEGAKLNGNGTYTVTATTEGTDTVADGMYLLAICAYDATAYENAVFTVDSIKIDGAEVALTGSECVAYAYDDELDVYIYDSWSEESIFDGASVGEWSTIEVTFTVSGM